MYKNPLTSFRDPIQLGDRYLELETIRLRQKLGNISAGELAELNSLFGGSYSMVLSRAGNNQPR